MKTLYEILLVCKACQVAAKAEYFLNTRHFVAMAHNAYLNLDGATRMYSAYIKERTPCYGVPVMALVAYQRAKRVQESINFWSTRFNGTW